MPSEKEQVLVLKERNQEEIDFLESLLPDLYATVKYCDNLKHGGEYESGRANVADSMIDKINQRLKEIS